MKLNDLFLTAGLKPSDVLVFRHRPSEPELRKVFPWLAGEKPDVFNAYQQTQSERVEKALLRASYAASFIGDDAGKTIFVGLYKVGASRPLTFAEYWQVPAHIEMKKFGMTGFSGLSRQFVLWFDLQAVDFYREWKGKMIVRWPPPGRSWWRWSDRNEIPILAILEESLLDSAMPPWQEITLSWDQIGLLPAKWRSALSQWRGVYYIFDTSDGKGYVGAAYGADNILGRWMNYAVSGHGGNAQLRKRSPHDFRFSVLERVSPDMKASEIVRLEGTWKERLHTHIPFGLNDN